MNRKVGLALLVLVAVIGGLVLAVLLPRESDTSRRPTPVLVTTQTIPGSSTITTTVAGSGPPSGRRFTVAEVAVSFEGTAYPCASSYTTTRVQDSYLSARWADLRGVRVRDG